MKKQIWARGVLSCVIASALLISALAANRDTYGATLLKENKNSFLERYAYTEDEFPSADETEAILISTLSGQFTDVLPDAYYAEAVKWAVDSHITNGVSETSFAPDATCTRGQVATFLWRAAGEPEPSDNAGKFTDVRPDSPFYKAVLWAVEQGITNGTTESTFSPANPCTYAQVLTFLWRGKGSPAANGESELAVRYENAYYANALAWADTNGLLSKMEFIPAEQCPRADIVNYLYRSRNITGSIDTRLQTETDAPLVQESIPAQQPDFAPEQETAPLPTEAWFDSVPQEETHALSEYQEVPITSLIARANQYAGQRVKLTGRVFSVKPTVNKVRMLVYDKVENRQMFYVDYDASQIAEDFQKDDNIDIFGVMIGTDVYARHTVAVIQAEQIHSMSLSGALEIDREYGPFTIQKYLSSGKLFSRCDIDSFVVTNLELAIGKYRMEYRLSGKSSNSHCQFNICFLDENGQEIGKQMIVQSVTPEQHFSMTGKCYVEQKLIDNSASLRFASKDGDLAGQPRNENRSGTSETSDASSGQSGSTGSSDGKYSYSEAKQLYDYVNQATESMKQANADILDGLHTSGNPFGYVTVSIGIGRADTAAQSMKRAMEILRAHNSLKRSDGKTLTEIAQEALDSIYTVSRVQYTSDDVGNRTLAEQLRKDAFQAQADCVTVLSGCVQLLEAFAS